MATVRKREWKGADGKPKQAFIVDYKDFDGKRRQKTFDKRADAKEYCVKIQADLARGKRLTQSMTVTLSDVARQFMRSLEDRMKMKELSRSYFVSMETMVDVAALPYFGDRLLRDVTPAVVEEWRRWMIVTKGYKPQTARYRMRQLRLVEGFAVEEGYTEAEPLRRVLERSKAPPKEEVRQFTAQEVQHLLAVVQVRREGMRYRTGAMMQAIVTIAALSGLRYGEIMALRPCDLDLDLKDGWISVNGNMSAWKERGTPKTGAGHRETFMPARVRGALQAYMKHFHSGKPGDLLFTTNSGKTISNGEFHVHYWQPLLEAAGLGERDEKGRRFHFHALRHYTASWWTQIGIPGPDIAKMLGHTTYGMSLKVYVHSLTEKPSQSSAIEAAAGRDFPDRSPGITPSAAACDMVEAAE